MEYIIASLVAILLTTLIVYKLANSVFGLGLRFKPLLLCALCAMLISLILPKIVVGFAGLPGTLAVLAIFAIIFAYFIAKYEDESDSGSQNFAAATETDCALEEKENQLDMLNQLQSTADDLVFDTSKQEENQAEVITPVEPFCQSVSASTLPDKENEVTLKEYEAVPYNEASDKLEDNSAVREILVAAAEDKATFINEESVTESGLPSFSAIESASTIAAEDTTKLEEVLVGAELTASATTLDEPNEVEQVLQNIVTGDIQTEDTPKEQTDIMPVNEPTEIVAALNTVNTIIIDEIDEVDEVLTEGRLTLLELDAAVSLSAQNKDDLVEEQQPTLELETVKDAGLENFATTLLEPDVGSQDLQVSEKMITDNNAAIDVLQVVMPTEASPLVANDENIGEKIIEEAPESGWEAEKSTMTWNDQLQNFASEDLDDLLEYAFISKEKNDYASAFNAFSRALALYPDSEAAPFLVVEIGNILKNKGAYDEAIKVLSEGRSISQRRQDEMMEQEFISAIAYLRITKNILLQNRLGNIRFTEIPAPIVQQIDEEFKEWRNVGNI